MKKLFFMIIILFVLLLTCKNENTIKVKGFYSEKVIPDYLNLKFTVKTENENHKICQNKNFEISQKAITLLKEKYSIANEDIQTYDYNLRNYDKYISQYKKINSFISENEIFVKIIKLSDLNNLLSDLIDVGVNEINYINYKISNYNDIEKNVLNLAVKNAKEKAEIIAQNEKLKIIGIKKITEIESITNNYNFIPEGPPGYESDLPPSYRSVFQEGTKDIQKLVIIEFKFK